MNWNDAYKYIYFRNMYQCKGYMSASFILKHVLANELFCPCLPPIYSSFNMAGSQAKWRVANLMQLLHSM